MKRCLFWGFNLCGSESPLLAAKSTKPWQPGIPRSLLRGFLLMCVVVDINALCFVFGEDAHGLFAPIKNWITNGNGFFVFGGDKYIQELYKTQKYVKIIRLLNDKGRVRIIKKDVVNRKESELRMKIGCSDCDDHHIIAILDSSGCRLLCSVDKRSFRFVKDRTNYTDNKRPKIYSGIRQTKLVEFLERDGCNLKNIDRSTFPVEK